MREITLVFFGILAGISYDINVCHLWILKAEDCVGTDFTHSSYFFGSWQPTLHLFILVS